MGVYIICNFIKDSLRLPVPNSGVSIQGQRSETNRQTDRRQPVLCAHAELTRSLPQKTIGEVSHICLVTRTVLSALAGHERSKSRASWLRTSSSVCLLLPNGMT